LLVLAVAIVFGQTLHHEFVNYDDDLYVCNNEQLTAGLSLEGIAWAFTSTDADNWHPLTWISHLADYTLYGLKPGGHHLSSVVLHAASVVLLFLVLFRMTGEGWPSALVAGVFAIHPLRVESVAWVAERKDVLCGLFFMLTLGLYTGYARRAFSLVRYVAVLISFALGLMAKPMLVTLPFVLLLLDYWPLGRFDRSVADLGSSPARAEETPWFRVRRLILEKIPFLLLTVASCVVTTWSQSGCIRPLSEMSLPSRTANVLLSYVSYLGQLFWPTNLAPFYPYPASLPAFWKIAAAGMLLLGLTAGALAMRRKIPYLLVGWLWYLGMLVPVIGLVKVGLHSTADRYTYLPLIGPCMVLVWAVKDISRAWRYRNWAISVAAALVIGTLMRGAWLQVSHWRDSVTLWNHTLACTTGNHLAHGNLGVILANRGRLHEAIEHYRKALETRPDDATVCNNLGCVLVDVGRASEGIEYYQKALKTNPTFSAVYFNLGNAYVRQKRLDEALVHYQKAVELSPDVGLFHNNLGATLANLGRFAEAVEHYHKAMDFRPDLPDPHYNLGNVMARRGQLDRAIFEWREAIRIDPKDVKSHLALGRAYHRQQKFTDAARHFRTVLRINPKSTEARQGLKVIQGRSRNIDESRLTKERRPT
jgi:tetratricopeptide (TPR) repeat protein